jgi:Ribosomal protein S3AE
VETNIRNAINEFLKEKASSLPLDQLVVYMLSTNYPNDAYEKIKNIYPTRKIELRKSEVLREKNKQETIEEAQAEAEV